jgi:membrane protein DedA with SNARE-associated domain
MLHLSQHLQDYFSYLQHFFRHLLHDYGYGAITLSLMIECAGVPAPGELVLLTASLAASRGHFNIYLVVAYASLGAILGNALGYTIGRKLGHALIVRYGPRVGLTPSRQAVGRFLFARHGGKVVFLGRFTAFLRPFAALLAGANQMPRRPFAIYTIAGGIAWPCLHGFGTYALGTLAQKFSGTVTLVFSTVVLIGLGLMIYLARRNEHKLEAAALRWQESQGVT